MTHLAGKFNQALHRSQADRQFKKLQLVDKANRVDPRAEFEGKDTARTGCLPLQGFVPRQAFDPGIVNLCNVRPGSQVVNQLLDVGNLPVKAQAEGLYSPGQFVAIFRRQDRAEGILNEVDPLGECWALNDDGPSGNVGVTRKVLGGTVDDNVGPQGQRPQEERYCPRSSTAGAGGPVGQHH